MFSKIRDFEVIDFSLDKLNQDYFSIQIQYLKEEPTIKYNFGDINIHEGSASNLLILNAGEKSKLSKEKWRKLGGVLAKYLKSHSIKNIYIENEIIDTIKNDYFLTFCEGFFLGNYNFDIFKQDYNLETINLIINCQDEDLQDEILKTQKVSSIVNYGRELGQLPGNVINPLSLAEICNDIALQNNLKIKIYDENELENIGAHALLNVGKGSASKPRLIILEYNAEKPEFDNPIVLVGKAITFDTGGYSIKNVDGIKGMKSDKLGGITVLASMIAASQVKISKNVVGIICAAENMISDEAYRPDDIIKTLSGKTVEILSTDAEGRLVLADGLTYAQQNYKPHCIIDFATLTGGIVVALGRIRAGLFSNNKELSDQLFNSGESTSEKLWPMPLDDDYFEFIKGDDSDLKNSGGREGHPIMGGIFLKQFIENDIPWAHLDIAGAAVSLKSENYQPKGANGFGIRLVLDFLINN